MPLHWVPGHRSRGCSGRGGHESRRRLCRGRGRAAGRRSGTNSWRIAMKADMVVKNGILVTAEGQFPGVGVGIVDGRFAVIARDADLPSARETVDVEGRHILPGVIDGHVHFREPGLEYKEDFGSGSLAAVMGGVTSVVEMPNTKPPTDRPENVRLKQRLAEEKSYCDFGIIGVVVMENIDQLEPMAAAGGVGYKCLMGE